MKVLYENLLNSIIDNDSLNPGYLADNLLEPVLAMKVEFADKDIFITYDLGATNISIDAFSICGHNLTSNATITLKFNTSDSWGSPAATETLTWYADNTYNSFTAKTYRYVRLEIQDAGNTEDLTLGYTIGGIESIIVDDEGIGVNRPLEYPTNSIPLESRGNSLYGTKNDTWFETDLPFPILTSTEATKILTLWGYVHNVISFVLVVYEDDLTLQGPLFGSLDQEILSFDKINLENQTFKYATTLRFKERF